IKEWGMDQARIMDLKKSVKFTVYTPGSKSGELIRVLSSLEAPDLDWEENSEIILERISSTVTALLGLVGIKDVDPISSREHILLSKIFAEHWQNKKDIDFEELIRQTQSPSFKQVGAFSVDEVFPQKD